MSVRSGFILGAIMWKLTLGQFFLRVGVIYFATVFIGYANSVEVRRCLWE